MTSRKTFDLDKKERELVLRVLTSYAIDLRYGRERQFGRKFYPRGELGRIRNLLQRLVEREGLEDKDRLPDYKKTSEAASMAWNLLHFVGLKR